MPPSASPVIWTVPLISTVAESKAQLVAAWSRVLEDRLAALDSSQSAARAGTRVDGSHRPENRGERGAVTSQGYLAHGLQLRMDALAEQLRHIEDMGAGPRAEVVVGAWLELETEDGELQQLAVFPGGDATRVAVGATTVQILSPQSPRVGPLMGLEDGDGATLPGLGEVEIRWIR